MKSLARRALIGLFLAVAVLAALAWYADAGKLRGHLGAFSARAVLIALGLALANYALRYLRWEYNLRHVGIVVPRSTSALVFVSGFSMSITPGKVGELLKSALLKEAADTPVVRSAPVVIAERVTDLTALLLLVVGSLAFVGASAARGPGAAWWPMVIGGGALVLFGLLFLTFRPLAHGLFARFSRPNALGHVGRVGRLVGKVRETYDHLADLVALRPLLVAAALALAAWLCECLGFFVLVGALPGAGVSVAVAVFIYAAATVAGALSFLPGGLLVTEAGMIFFLVNASSGLDHTGAVAATLVTRMCTLWFAVALGFGALVAFRRLAAVSRANLAKSSKLRP